MCTIMTITHDMLSEEMITQILCDATRNSDGYSLVLDDVLAIQCMEIEPIMTILNTVSWERMWLHCRAATSSDVGVHTCHSFYTKDRQFLVMHNGIISDGLDLTVDSMWIANLIDSIGIDPALDVISTRLTFANVFIIDMSDLTYYVTRATQGTLYTDNIGNFSTHRIESINSPVEHNSMDVYAADKQYKPTPKWSSYGEFYKSKETSPYLHNNYDYYNDDDFDVYGNLINKRGLYGG